MSNDDDDGQMIFGDLVGLKLADICLTGEEKPRKNLTQETCPDRGSNPPHSGGPTSKITKTLNTIHTIHTIHVTIHFNKVNMIRMIMMAK